jgi:hypothetical protein
VRIDLVEYVPDRKFVRTDHSTRDQRICLDYHAVEDNDGLAHHQW